MPNHFLIVLPESQQGLRQAIGEAHRRYTRRINFRHGWRGHLWQGRFASFPMDERYFLAATRYIELNPVRAGLVKPAEQYPWSSAQAHLTCCNDILVTVGALTDMVRDWGRFLSEDLPDDEIGLLRRHERTGRRLGSDSFIDRLEKTSGRILRRQKPGPKPKQGSK